MSFDKIYNKNINRFIDTQQFDGPWAYAVQTPIHCSDFACLDFDINEKKIVTINKNQDATYENFNIEKMAKYLLTFHSVERIDIYTSSMSITNGKSRYHMFIKMNGVYDCQSIYKNVNICQLACGGHIKTNTHRNSSTIRISEKFNVIDNDKILKQAVSGPPHVEKGSTRITVPLLTKTFMKRLFTPISYEKDIEKLKKNKFADLFNVDKKVNKFNIRNTNEFDN